MSLSYHTDNTLMSRISHSNEASVLLEHTPLTEHDLLSMALQCFGGSGYCQTGLRRD